MTLQTPAAVVTCVITSYSIHYTKLYDLGLPPETNWLELSALNTRFVLIQLYNTLCNDCVAETKKLSAFFQTIENDPVLAGQLKIIGLGIYDSNQNVMRFKKHYDVAYPLFSDKSGQIFECLGQNQLPLAYLVRAKGDGSWIIELIKRGYFDPDETFRITSYNVCYTKLLRRHSKIWPLLSEKSG